jgi:RHS repeat-associated protein
LAGNLTRDDNRRITAIAYNALGLAESITFGNGTIRYVYSGGGSKLRKEGAFVPTNDVPSQTPSVGQQTLDYVAGLLYTDNALSHVPTGEGRALPPLPQLGSEWRYEYQQSDHLGNLRSACRCGEQVNASTGAVEPLVGAEPRVLVQSGHYDPWGLNLSDLETKTGKGVDLWQFTGQERDYQGYTEFKLRQYDPTIGRFMSVDPMADAFGWVSPFNYAENSPIANIDLYGLQAKSVVSPRDFTYSPSSRPGLPSIPGPASENLSGALGIASGIAQAVSTAMPKLATPTISSDPTAQLARMNPNKRLNYVNAASSGKLPYGLANSTLVADFNLDYEDATRPPASGAVEPYNIDVDLLTLGYGTGIRRGVGSFISRLYFDRTRIASFPGNIRLRPSVPTGQYYSVAFEMELKSTSYPGIKRSKHFLEANEALEATMQADPDFATSMNNLGITIPRNASGNIIGESPVNWVWHHDAFKPGGMQLVPKTQHPNTTNGIFWSTLHPDRRGGFSRWGK